MNLNATTTNRPITELQPHPDNPRRGNIDAIRESLQLNGQYAPIVAQKSTGYIIAGSHRLEAAKQLGWTEMLVTTVDVDDETAKRILLADNRTSDLGFYDNDSLYALLNEVAASTLEGTGWDYDALDDLNALLEESGHVPTDAVMGIVNTDAQPNWEQRQQEYKNKSIRSIILDYQLSTFEWVANSAEQARAELGIESIADLFIALLADHLDIPAPE